MTVRLGIEQKLQRLRCSSVRQRIRLGGGGGLISFCFDDFPRSSWLVGGSLLAEREVKSTYYVAMGLAGKAGPHGAHFDMGDLAELTAAGHEIGCHTFSHTPLGRQSRSSVRHEFDQNRLAMSKVGLSADSFSYPLGEQSVRARLEIRARFKTGRGIAQGVNLGEVDLLGLRANAIYGDLSMQRSALALIDEVSTLGGWLILYTHDVARDPSTQGCTPELFATVLDAAVASPCTIETVRDAARIVVRQAEIAA